MAQRTVYGNSVSENGWPMVDEGSCEWVTVQGTNVTLELQVEQPATILRAFAADFNAYVEPLRDPDSAGWTPTNSVPTSNHLSGTAMDLNWNSHPFQVWNAGFSAEQISVIRQLLDFYEDTIFWGNDWDTPKDAMHWQMGYNTFGNPHTADFISRKIRSDGYSTYRRDPGTGPDAAQILSDAMGNSLTMQEYRGLLKPVSESLRACECTTVDRVAMWVAQIGHESGGLKYTEEIADGSEYEGRVDLGNTQPGDGARFKGRSWIQITGRWNYAQLSQWAYSQGLAPSETYFVDNPEDLAREDYAGLGAAWYWTVARPDINALADAHDIVGVTRRINGGTNGLSDRESRYNRALELGAELMALVGTDQPGEGDFMADGTLYESLSLYATPGEGAIYTLADLLRSVDGMKHREMTEEDAVRGDPDAIHRVALVAAGQGKYRDTASVNHAQRVLEEIEAKNPDALRNYLAKNGA